MAGLAVLATLVSLRIAAASWSNVLQKQSLTHDKPALSLLVEIWGWMALLSAPAWLLAATNTGATVHASFWLWMLAASMLEMPGNWLLLRSLQQTDLSIYGPLNSFKPAIGLIAAVMLLGEFPTPLGLVGMGIVLLGSCGLPVPRDGQNRRNWSALFAQQGMRDRMLAMLLTATASVFLKRAMPGATEWEVLGVWSLLGWLLAIVFLRATQSMKNRQRSAIKSTDRLTSGASPGFFSARLMLIAVSMLVMQGLTIALFARMPVAYALALFQLGSLASVYLGHRVFGEPHLWRRLAASVIMILGAILIVFAK